MKSTKHNWLKWVGLFLAATFLGVLFASQAYLSYLYRGYEANFAASLRFVLPSWYVWALLVPVIVWLGRRFPIARVHWLKNCAAHLAAGVAVSLSQMAVLAGVTGWIELLPHRAFTLVQINSNLVTYFAILGLSHAFDYYRKFREKEVRTSQLETRLVQAELQVLKMQLQPHFLFNTLHAISALMHKDVEAADRMMARLSDLLRLTLDNTGVHEVTLKKELEFLEGYLEIEQTRFQDRLTVTTNIGPETLDACVPNLILQPLVENAIRHGIEPFRKRGQIEISARRDNGSLHVEIHDSGPGIKNSANSDMKEGIGLANTRARLTQLYAENFSLDLCSQAADGFTVTLNLPFTPSNQSSN